MTILVIGATGTLGRQIVREMLGRGYRVSCLVRNLRKANFLVEWGANLIYGDLRLPETLPQSLSGIRIILDVSTLRAEDELGELFEVDLIGKISLIKAAKIASVDHFIFFSIKENDLFKFVPLMYLKKKIENTLKNSKLPYTIVQLSGFYQGIINQFATPILEQQTVYTTLDSRRNSYINTQDLAKICIKYLKYCSGKNMGYIIQMDGPRAWSSKEILRLCEDIPGQIPTVTYLPLFVLILVKNFLALTKWTWEIEDRLSFTELSSKDNLYKVEDFDKNTLNNFVIYKEDLVSLDNYLIEYFENMLQKLTELKYDQSRALKRKDLTF